MKIGIFDPYLDTLGGGEKYILTAAQCLSSRNKVSVFWPPHRQEQIKEMAKQRLNINLSSITFTRNIFTKDTPFLQRILATRDYDVIFYISNGSIPLLLGKKNILLFQFPVPWVNGQDFLTRLKLRNINKIICYSYFVKQFLDKTFNIDSKVLPPSVDRLTMDRIKRQKVPKENIILSVGRFTRGLNTKKQEILIRGFKNMCDRGLRGWKLVLVGLVLQDDKDFIQQLKNEIGDYPIEIFIDLPFAKLTTYYKKAKIYWHAAGFGEDLEKHPERFEHFGISTVEAMGSGAVPIVFNGGGQKEIVSNGENGILWDTLQGLQDKTLWVMRDEDTWQRLSGSAKSTAMSYNKERFCREITKLVE